MLKALALTVGVLLPVAARAEDRLPDGGGEVPVGQTGPCLTEEQRQEIRAQLYRSAAELRLGSISTAAVGLAWPLGNATPHGDAGVHGISNFVDQNPLFPNLLLDYNCGARTYDTASGYNHSGIDIFTWPFYWLKMDRSEVPIVAAAPGIILFKSDGNFDRSCATAGGTWNAVYVQHADGSVAWYGHMKNGSPTTKPVGSPVVAGEYLGIVGSSGNSTGPHLHFELYDASDGLIDPYEGPCNSLNATGWWTAQRPYRDSAVNKLSTQTAPPVFPACPNAETPNLSNHFVASPTGTPITFAVYLRDEVAGEQVQLTVQRPDGSTWNSFNTSGMNTYNASYWWFNRTLPSGPVGRWNLRAVFMGVTYNHTFHLLADGDLIFEDGFQLGL